MTDQDLKDEESLMGALIVSPEAIYTAQEFVTAKDFISTGFADVFLAIQSLLAKSVPLNIQTISIELDRVKVIDKIGGITRLAELLKNGLPHHTAYYAEQVAKASQRRRLRMAIADLHNQAQSPSFEPMELAGQLSSASTLVDVGSKDQKSIGVVLSDFLEDCEIKRQQGHVAVMPTGLKTLDESLFGGLPSGYITIGARP